VWDRGKGLPCKGVIHTTPGRAHSQMNEGGSEGGRDENIWHKSPLKRRQETLVRIR